MNYEQIKRLRIENSSDLGMFFGELINKKSAIIFDNAATFAINWIDTIYSGDEELSFKTWVLTLAKLKKYFDNTPDGATKSDFKEMYAYIHELNIILNESKIKTLPFMTNTKKWHSLFCERQDDASKVIFYSMHAFLMESLIPENFELISLDNFLKEEDKKIRIGVAAYSKFMQWTLKL